MCDHNCNQGRTCTCGKSSGLVTACVVLVWVVTVAAAAIIVWG